ncbi:fatty acid desaturase [Rhodosalinus sp. K401]|uniref:fatty acid desaturase n=1 Tax=Rhodosalinus sp. K401 TaxID=3239195 RepID=UPI0035264446
MKPQQWTRVLTKYREPIPARSLFELSVTLLPFLAIWALAWWALSISPVLSVALAMVNAGFLVRTFMIQHDCGHGSFFRNRKLGDWIGRALGVLTLTPYDVWRKTHAIHHATTGNLDQRGTGDVPVLTVTEYRSKSRLGRVLYRLLRHPLVMFGIVPFYTFFLQNRLPVGLMRSGWRYWLSSQATNAGIGGLLALLIWFGGLEVVLFIFVPTMLLAASLGMWMFYVQHQFEDTVWERQEDWNVHEAALHGSSNYILPPVLNWLTGNIGAHHVHHLASRIPFYRLPEVLRDHDDLVETRRLTLRESLRCASLALWDENDRKLISFAEARRRP